MYRGIPWKTIPIHIDILERRNVPSANVGLYTNPPSPNVWTYPYRIFINAKKRGAKSAALNAGKAAAGPYNSDRWRDLRSR